MKKPKFWDLAKKELKKKDAKLGKIIESYPEDFLYSRSDPFYTLSRSIVGQQISVKAAQSVWEKLISKVEIINPKQIKKIHSNTLKSSGLSRQKVVYLKNLANAFVNNELKINIWHKMEDEEIILDLIKVKGIGKWTAEMFLIFNLCRPDVFPISDIGVINGIKQCYNIKNKISENKLISIGNKWRPYRSVATWYLWRSLDPLPVEY